MTEQPDAHVYAMSMIEKIKDPQIRATLGYMLGMMKTLEIKLDTTMKALEATIDTISGK